MTLTTKHAAILAQLAEQFAKEDETAVPETQEQNYARAAAVRVAGGSLPDGLAITEIVNGEVREVVKSRGNALRQIQAGISRYVGRYSKD